VDINRYPSAIIEIIEKGHTSKKGKIVIKVFQSGKINIDSIIEYEHIYTTYRFFNELIIKHGKYILYIPATSDDEYDSEHYYEEIGIEPPPADLV
jgi:imidazoleglycerol phosphate dehydratase HisB